MRHSLPPPLILTCRRRHMIWKRKSDNTFHAYVRVCVSVAKWRRLSASTTIWKISSYRITMNNNNIPPYATATVSVWTVAIQLTQQQQKEEKGRKRRHNGPLDSISKQQLRQREKREIAGKMWTTSGAIFVHTAEGTSQDKEKKNKSSPFRRNIHVSGHCRRKASGAPKD